MVALDEGQYELDGLVLGAGTPYVVTAFEDGGLPERRTQDVEFPDDDGQAFGRDAFGGMLPTLDVMVETAGGGPSFDAVQAFRAKWRGDATRKTPGAVQVLRVRRPGGTTRRTYGRSNRATPVLSRNTGVGLVPVVADFRSSDDRWYDDEPVVEVVGVAPPTTGGLTTTALEGPVVNQLTDPALANGVGLWSGLTYSGGDATITGASAYTPNVTAAPDDVVSGVVVFRNPTGATITGSIRVNSTAAGLFAGGHSGPLVPVSVPAGETLEFGGASVTLLPGEDGARILISGGVGLVVEGALVAVGDAAYGGPYFDGDTDGDGTDYSYSWQGTPAASTSVRVDHAGGFVFPITTAAATERPGQIVNPGDVDTWPVVTVEGQVAGGWSVELRDRDGVPLWVLESSLALEAGQSVTIDTRPWARTVLRENGANVSGSRTRRSTRLGDVVVPPGESVLVVTGSSPAGNATATLSFEPAYAGH